MSFPSVCLRLTLMHCDKKPISFDMTVTTGDSNSCFVGVTDGGPDLPT